jgi:hypothetical protein
MRGIVRGEAGRGPALYRAGHLPADEYRPGDIVEVGCWAHARRYFHEARDTDAARSAEAFTRIRDFYRVEDEARDLITRQQLVGEAADAVRLQLRQERTKVKLVAFAAWLEDQTPCARAILLLADGSSVSATGRLVAIQRRGSSVTGPAFSAV